MTTVCVLCDPPREGLVLPELPETSPLSAAEAAGLYGAMLKDCCRTVEGSGGDLLVNYRDDDALPEGFDAPVNAREQLESIVGGALADPESARYEVQVGESFYARAGNTVTHLLREEGVNTVAVVEPPGALCYRTYIDEAAMKLRTREVVLGPGTRGRVYYAGFADPIDFTDAYAAPALQTLTDRGRDAGHDVDFLPTLPVIETGADLLDALPLLRARRAAGRVHATETLEYLEGLGLSVVEGAAGLELTR